uniref:FAM50A/XAP5 C-terminal domain-containing protein n=1 Tax=Chrysotila carterae TaxID=13221 RepID=A0A7S4EVB5_CHRCT|mmetsp:Transcript_8277/g.18091  ORF Transcript_8277/g.18091 Transcript_8277/m.18091 type:complete len:302 (-) Transcript_8277:251-1156(-)
MSDAIERQLAAASKGYMSKEEYKRKREELEQEAAMAHARKSMPLPPDAQAEAAKKKKVKKQKPPTGSLSFGDDLEGEAEPSPRAQPKKMGKCTNVDVSFLKKNEREEHEAALAQERAMREYLQFQQRAKQESITLNYTFRSEATQRELPNAVHRGSVTVLKGLTAEEVARLVRADVEKLGDKFKLLQVAGKKEERDLMFVAGANGMTIGCFIIPLALSLVELSFKKWEEGTPLLDDFKAGIVVTERRWYEQMRHTFPYSQWTVFDPHKTYSQREFIANRNSGSGVDPSYRKGNTVSKRTGR